MSDNSAQHVPDDLIEPVPDAMTFPPPIDAIENPDDTSNMIITDSDSSCSELDINGITKLESTPDGVVPQEPESATCSDARKVVPEHRAISKPHGRKNVQELCANRSVILPW